MDDPRRRLSELMREIQRTLGDSLVALYLYGSLPVGGFVEGKSDIDLLAVTTTDVTEAQRHLLARAHRAFAAAHPEWDDRVEVGYVSESVVKTFSSEPSGSFAVISPGEPLHVRSPDASWVLNWKSLVTSGETLYGPRPLEIGSPVPPDVLRRVVLGQLDRWVTEVRSRRSAESRSYQGYVALTVSRALYCLETGDTTTKEGAAEWAAGRFPEWAAFLRDAVRWHRADPSAAPATTSHATTIRFVEFAADRHAARRGENA